MDLKFITAKRGSDTGWVGHGWLSLPVLSFLLPEVFARVGPVKVDGAVPVQAFVSLPDVLEVLPLDSGGRHCSPQSQAQLHLQCAGAGVDNVLDLSLAGDLQNGEEPDPVALTGVLPGNVLHVPGALVPVMEAISARFDG